MDWKTIVCSLAVSPLLALTAAFLIYEIWFANHPARN